MVKILNKALFLGEYVRGGWLTSHETNWCEGLHDFVGLVRNSDVLSETNRVKTTRIIFSGIRISLLPLQLVCRKNQPPGHGQ